MLFFRTNATTIEVIEEKDESEISQDILWGLAWEVEDINKKIDENLINKFAPKVVEGVNKLKNWSETL